MKKKLMALIVSGILAVASSAWSYHVSLNTLTLDVGLQDQWVASVDSSTLGNSGDTTELGWVNKTLGTQYTSYDDKYQVAAEDWTKVIDPVAGLNMYALHLLDNPDYFIIKTGNSKNKSSYDMFLFDNLAAADWAVIDLAEVEILEVHGIVNLGKMSHAGEIGTQPVPEPGTVMLLGAGFLGLAIYGKRRRNV